MGNSNIRNAARINARIDRLPSFKGIWVLVLIIALGGWFEYFDMLFTAYIGPGLVKSGLFSATTTNFFGFKGLASFIAATFGGMLVGTSLLGTLADRYGRKTIFLISLIWYTTSSAIMAFQQTTETVLLWRFIASIGIGLELVTIGTYISELVPKHLRTKAFALCEVITFTAVPTVALLAWQLVPITMFGLEGWRLVVLTGSVLSLLFWIVRFNIPESPRWLAQKGRLDEASAIVNKLEMQAMAAGKEIKPIVIEEYNPEKGSFSELFRKPYLGRTTMLAVFNFFQTVGYYGFASWLPTLLISKGIPVTTSLAYAFVIAIANPIGPALGLLFADKVENKWIITIAASGIAIFGLMFAGLSTAGLMIACGSMIVICSNIMVFAFRAYQAELFPTRIRGQAVGFVFSFSRISAIFSGFMIAWFLNHFGVQGAFGLIIFAMFMVISSIGIFGPKTKGQSLNEISK